MTKQGNSKHLFLRETSSGQTRKTSSGQTKKGLEDCSVILSDSSCKKENIRFTTVPFKTWVDQE